MSGAISSGGGDPECLEGSGGVVQPCPARLRIRLATAAMGTRFELAIEGRSEPDLRAAGEEALREIELWHDRLSRFLPHSDISRLNRDPTAMVHPETRALLDQCDRLREDTGGAFDVRASGGDLDLGAIGKGVALDRACSILRECGVTSALLHGGTSSVVAIGEHRVAVECSGVPLRIRLNDLAMGVSSNRQRIHIRDPRTGGLPPDGPDTAVVVGPEATLCDAWSSALLVLGSPPERFPEGYESHLHESPGGWRSGQPSKCASP